jgi:hypothetical protein
MARPDSHCLQRHSGSPCIGKPTRTLRAAQRFGSRKLEEGCSRQRKQPLKKTSQQPVPYVTQCCGMTKARGKSPSPAHKTGKEDNAAEALLRGSGRRIRGAQIIQNEFKSTGWHN